MESLVEGKKLILKQAHSRALDSFMTCGLELDVYIP